MEGKCQYHLKRDMTAAAAVGHPQMKRAAAKASAQESLQGFPKFTGLAAISQGRSLGAAPLIRPAAVKTCLTASLADHVLSDSFTWYKHYRQGACRHMLKRPVAGLELKVGCPAQASL